MLNNFIQTELPQSKVILSNIIDRSDNGIAKLKISNFNKHLNSLKTDTIGNGNISSEHFNGFNGSVLHLNRHGKGKLAMNLIKKLRGLRRRSFNRNWQQNGHSLARLQYYVLNCVCSNDCKRRSDTAGPKHLLEIKHASSSADFQDTGNQMNTLHEIKIKNSNRLIIGHLHVNSLRNNFEMLKEFIKDKIDMFLNSETKLDFSFSSGQFVIKGYGIPFRLDRNQKRERFTTSCT